MKRIKKHSLDVKTMIQSIGKRAVLMDNCFILALIIALTTYCMKKNLVMNCIINNGKKKKLISI